MGLLVHGTNKFVCIYLLYLCYFDQSESDINCNFNDGEICPGWTFEDNTTLCAANWTIWKGPTLTANTGPPGDRLDKDGYYIYLESTNQKHRDIGIFYTPVLETTQETVNLTFWYYMHGIFIQNLKVYMYPKNGGKKQRLITIQGEQGPKWNISIVYIEERGYFRIGFQAMVGSVYSDIAVDDISIIGAKEVIPSTITVQTAKAETTTENIHDETIEDSFVPLPYIIICSVGGLMWIIILVLLCCCIRRADKIGMSNRSVGCNTPTSMLLDTNGTTVYHDEDVSHDDCVSDYEKIELTLDVRQLQTEQNQQWQEKTSILLEGNDDTNFNYENVSQDYNEVDPQAIQFNLDGKEKRGTRL